MKPTLNEQMVSSFCNEVTTELTEILNDKSNSLPIKAWEKVSLGMVIASCFAANVLNTYREFTDETIDEIISKFASESKNYGGQYENAMKGNSKLN